MTPDAVKFTPSRHSLERGLPARVGVPACEVAKLSGAAFESKGGKLEITILSVTRDHWHFLRPLVHDESVC